MKNNLIMIITVIFMLISNLSAQDCLKQNYNGYKGGAERVGGQYWYYGDSTKVKDNGIAELWWNITSLYNAAGAESLDIGRVNSYDFLLGEESEKIFKNCSSIDGIRIIVFILEAELDKFGNVVKKWTTVLWKMRIMRNTHQKVNQDYHLHMSIRVYSDYNYQAYFQWARPIVDATWLNPDVVNWRY